jgi:hypothetical protein
MVSVVSFGDQVADWSYGFLLLPESRQSILSHANGRGKNKVGGTVSAEGMCLLCHQKVDKS